MPAVSEAAATGPSIAPAAAAAAAAAPRPAWRTLRPVLAAALLVAVALAALVGWPETDARLRWTASVLAAATVAWTLLRADETRVALLAALALLAGGAVTPATFYAALGHEVVWLMLGAFVMAVAWKQTGLVERGVAMLSLRVRRVAPLFRVLTLAIAATALVVPSTSARAALLLPVFLALAPLMPGERAVRGLALLFPSVILLSAGISLLGAGAHLVAVDALQRVQGHAPGFLGWLLLAGPFGLLSSLLACELILRTVLRADDREAVLPGRPAQGGPKAAPTPLTREQRATLAVQGLVIAAWCTPQLHGVPVPVVALAGALLMTWPRLTGVDLKQALRQVEWPLLLFLAATLVMAQALVDSGAAAALASGLREGLALDRWPPAALVGAVSAIALLSHLVVTSRTARASLLIVLVALPLAQPAVPAALLILCVTLGSGFCQTLPVSAKPVALFTGPQAASPADLLRLSLLLALPLWALLWGFAWYVWRHAPGL
jgi:di/tricarboxylate transporter